MYKRAPSFGEHVVTVGQLAVTAGRLIDRLPPPALVDETPSLPRCVYLRDWDGQPRRGAIVALEQPEKACGCFAFWGMPSDLLLIKRVAAKGGDEVCNNHGLHHTPERLVRVPARDKAGLPLPKWTGRRRLEGPHR